MQSFDTALEDLSRHIESEYTKCAMQFSRLTRLPSDAAGHTAEYNPQKYHRSHTLPRPAHHTSTGVL